MRRDTRRFAAGVAAVLGSAALVLAGCSSSPPTSAPTSSPAEAGVANAVSYAVKNTGTVTISGVKATITGGSITGPTGTITVKVLGMNETAQVTDASISATQVSATVALGGESGSGTLTGANYVYSGTVSGSETVTISGLTLIPVGAQAGKQAGATTDSYAISPTGSVTVAAVRYDITGGSLNGESGTLTVKNAFAGPNTIALSVGSGSLTPTTLVVGFEFFRYNFPPAFRFGTLSGSGYVYSGTLKASDNNGPTVFVKNLTMTPAG